MSSTAIVLICFGTAWLMSLAGLSLALGAFLAGLVISESEHGNRAFSEILPLKDIFSIIFFVSIGMLLDVSSVLRNPIIVILVVLAMMDKILVCFQPTSTKYFLHLRLSLWYSHRS